MLSKVQILVGALLLACASMEAIGESIIPDIGDTANIAITPAEESRLGKIILAQIRGSLAISDDLEANEYIRTAGIRLLNGISSNQKDFTFLILDNPRLNAFATPGGVIVLNAGLILNADNESELLGVMAHEIAHVVQRHMARIYAASKGSYLTTAITILGSILAGIYSSDAGKALSTFGQAAQVDKALSFSRLHEKEADRIGMNILVSSNYDPHGIPAFLKKINKIGGQNKNAVFEWLMTHPLTLSRISDTENRASQYKGKFVRNSWKFNYMKARLLALKTNPNEYIKRFDKLTSFNKVPSNADLYGYAVAQLQVNNPDKALKVLNKIKSRPTVKTYVELTRADAYIQKQLYSEAISILEKLDRIYPKTEVILYYLCSAYLASGNYEKSFEKLQNIYQRGIYHPKLLKLFAEVSRKSNKKSQSYEAMSDFYALRGEYGASLDQLRLAKSHVKINSTKHARILEKMNDIKLLQEEIVLR
jgi:predicted Zn-dependent protease